MVLGTVTGNTQLHVQAFSGIPQAVVSTMEGGLLPSYLDIVGGYLPNLIVPTPGGHFDGFQNL